VGAPTWEPDDNATDEQVEKALLAAFLFTDPVLLAKDGKAAGLPVARIQRRALAWLTMITGRHLKLGHADPASTDGVHLLLPRHAPPPLDARQDEVLFRVTGLVQAGLLALGFLDQKALLREIYTDWVLRSTWHLLAARAVLRHYGERFPGIRRDLAAVSAMEKATRLRVNLTEVPREGLPEDFVPLYEGLSTSFALKTGSAVTRAAVEAVDAVDEAGSKLVVLGQARKLREHFRSRRLGPPPVPWFLGVVRPEWLLADLEPDETGEWKKGNKPLRQLLAAMARNKDRIPVPEVAPPKRQGLRARLKARFASGEDEDLAKTPAYGALRDEAHAKARTRREDQSQVAEIVREDVREYDEWDHETGSWKSAECRVEEPEAPAGSLAAYEQVLEANASQVRRIRRRFEALRQEERWETGLPDGPELDLDRLIIAYSDVVAGQQPRQDFHRRFVRRSQPVAVLTLVDLSGSTQGRVLHAQQEALVLFAEGLRVLGVPHAFSGFNGTHAQDVSLWRLKGFDEPLDEGVKKRLGSLRATGATRLGAVIRHATWMLDQRPEPRRVLLLLSDGKPEDRSGYRGSYGIQDSAVAVQQAARAGLLLRCISLDTRDGSYLPTIFGSRGYLQLNSVEELPMRLPELFRSTLR